ncbi:hypothetical protein [Amycolatopsis minnesotensis]|uniref:Head-to-tail stopper n=1 Tax=Amycolatopsis minnesotensis TaxID=337894 RepID=A0ABN2R1H1_9PSEU
MIFGDTITRVRPLVTQDRYGSDVLDYAAGARTVFAGVCVQPRSSAEATADERDMVTTGWRIYSPAGMDLDIEPVDRIEWAGRTCEVIGEIARWPHPIRPGEVHHCEVDIQKVSG